MQKKIKHQASLWWSFHHRCNCSLPTTTCSLREEKHFWTILTFLKQYETAIRSCHPWALSLQQSTRKLMALKTTLSGLRIRASNERSRLAFLCSLNIFLSRSAFSQRRLRKLNFFRVWTGNSYNMTDKHDHWNIETQMNPLHNIKSLAPIKELVWSDIGMGEELNTHIICRNMSLALKMLASSSIP